MPVFTVEESKIQNVPANDFVSRIDGLALRLQDCPGVRFVSVTEAALGTYTLEVLLHPEYTLEQEDFDKILEEYADADQHKIRYNPMNTAYEVAQVLAARG